MQLRTFSYKEWAGHEQEWILDELLLGSRNLVVGKNASGKTRTLNVIYGLSAHFVGAGIPTLCDEFRATFEHNEKQYIYELDYKNRQVTHERLIIDGVVYLDRGENGIGEIVAEKVNSSNPTQRIPFQAPPHIVAVFVRRDAIQHSFLEPLFQWANEVRIYRFAGEGTKGNLAQFLDGGPEANDRDERQVVGRFYATKKRFPDVFLEELKKDLKFVGYEIDDVFVGPPNSVIFEVQGPAGTPALNCLLIRESGVRAVIDQFSMSSGLFRVLALLIHVNAALLNRSATTLLIDDIGEGLDFERSLALIQRVREKAAKSNLQLVISTNDKFVMDSIPLDEWTVLRRVQHRVTVQNYTNSKDLFDRFAFTGLKNFSFFEMNATESVSIDMDEDDEDDEQDESGDPYHA
ncbi:AAA family ATPase [Paraburkholderia guartelaensis]|nr:AAA family ATPase [Paraburkholderia guartelaensis]